MGQEGEGGEAGQITPKDRWRRWAEKDTPEICQGTDNAEGTDNTGGTDDMEGTDNMEGTDHVCGQTTLTDNAGREYLRDRLSTIG